MSAYKVVLSGYSTAAFKLFYLSDEEGLSDLAESYAALLALKIGDSKGCIPKDQIIGMVEDQFHRKINALEKKIYYHSSEEEKRSNALEKQEIFLNMETETRAITLLLEECQYLASPIKIGKEGMGPLVNPRSTHFRRVQNTMESLASYSGLYASNIGPWARSSLERTKREILGLGEVFDGAKIFIKSNPRKLCSGCLYSMDRVEGMCAPVGPKCHEGLSHLLIEGRNL